MSTDYDAEQQAEHERRHHNEMAEEFKRVARLLFLDAMCPRNGPNPRVEDIPMVAMESIHAATEFIRQLQCCSEARSFYR